MDYEKEIKRIKGRNRSVESDKAWELSILLHLRTSKALVESNSANSRINILNIDSSFIQEVVAEICL